MISPDELKIPEYLRNETLDANNIPYVETNIYKSSKNVNLDALIEYKKDGKRCNFLDRY